jgi:pyruvate, orthophosphate dikinase
MITDATQTYVHAVERIDATDSARFGGKATGLARMAAAGIPVPPAFVIGTDGYRAFRAFRLLSAEGSLPKTIVEQTRQAMSRLESATGRRFGARDAVPLLVSVRSGAQVSMPGMMDTVLNLGITAGGALAIVRDTGNVTFALDTWVRFWRMFCDIVLDIDGEQVAESLAPLLAAGKADPTAQTFDALEAAVISAIAEQGATDVSTDPQWQLQRAIAAVFESMG